MIQWAKYRIEIKTLKLMCYGYIHKSINHKISFIDEIFKEIHTNNIDRLWRTVEEHIRKHKIKSLFYFVLEGFTSIDL